MKVHRQLLKPLTWCPSERYTPCLVKCGKGLRANKCQSDMTILKDILIHFPKRKLLIFIATLKTKCDQVEYQFNTVEFDPDLNTVG